MGFFGGLIFVQGFFGVLLEALRIFFGLIFAPIRSSTIPSLGAICALVMPFHPLLMRYIIQSLPPKAKMST